jgi:hypothetical protein
MPGLPPSIRARLSHLVLATLLPLMLLVIGLTVAVYRSDRHHAAQQARAVARGIALAVEAELHACIGAMEILAASPHLAAGDLTAFRAQAKAVLAREEPGSNIVLLREDGQHVMNLQAPPEAPLPARQPLDNLRRIFTTGRPSVSDEFLGAVMKRSVVAVDVPVRRADGSNSLVLSFIPSLSLFDAAIRRQDPPPGWVVSVFDRKGVNVARTPNPEQFVGKPASPTLLPLVLASDDGMAETTSLEGTPLLTAWSRPSPSGWSVGVGIPRATFYAPLWRTLGINPCYFRRDAGCGTCAGRTICVPHRETNPSPGGSPGGGAHLCGRHRFARAA